jgi:phosphoglycolate phosphatase
LVIVLFDLDGTVWDSQAGIVGCIEHTFECFGLTVPPREVLAANLGPPLQQMLAELGIPEDVVDEGVLRYRERYSEWGAYQAELYHGIVDLLEELSVTGRRLATATSKGEGPTHQMLGHFGIAGYFDVVGAATMNSTATTKALVLERALSELGDPAPDGCVMIGDRHYDVAGATEHGISCIGVSWGYGSEAELIEAGAAQVVDTVAELREALLGGVYR